jgi:nitrate/nitrite-specific signal transduction histidine kinase
MAAENRMSATPRSLASTSLVLDDLDAPLSQLATANRQRDALYQLSERLHRAASAQAIYTAALDAIEAALDCDRSSILLFDAAGVMQFVA